MVTDDNVEEISLEEILVEIIDTQIALIDAVAGGQALADADGLKNRLEDLRDLLENTVIESDDP